MKGEEMSDRRHFHISKGIDLTSIVIVLIMLGGATAGGVVWFAEVETRLKESESMQQKLMENDDRILDRLVTAEKRWIRTLENQDRRHDQQISQLNNQMSEIRQLLAQIALNTGGRTYQHDPDALFRQNRVPPIQRTYVGTDSVRTGFAPP